MSATPELPGTDLVSSGNGIDPQAAHGTPPEGAGVTADGQTLEQIENHRRQLQSKLDQALPWAKLAEHPRLAGLHPEALARFIDEMVPLTQRPDFAQYQAGLLGQQQADALEDEDLTPEQREIRELRALVAKNDQRVQSSEQEQQRYLVEARFERAEKEVDNLLGPAWKDRRPQVLSALQRLSSNGVAQHIGPMLLVKAYWNSFEDPESLFEAMTHHVQRREQARLTAQQSKGTTVPRDIVPGGAPPKVAKSWADAWELGRRDVENSR